MSKIIGNTTATPNPQPNWAQTDATKADYIKNKPNVLTEEEIIELIDVNVDKDVATATRDGLMSATDKANLDALVASAISVLSGSTAPTSDIGEDGDLYIVMG